MNKPFKRTSSAILRDHMVLALGVIVAAPLAITAISLAAPSSPYSAAPAPSAQQAPQALPPFVFETNVGQAGADTLFLASGLGYRILVKSAGFDIQPEASDEQPSENTSFSFKFIGAATERRPLMLEKTGSASSYSGHAMSPGQSMRADHFRRVGTNSLYPGIDVVYYSTNNHLEYDFVLAPHADPSRIVMALTGIEKATLDPDGNLNLVKGERTFRQKKPLAFQDIAEGVRTSVDARYLIAKADDGSIRLALDLGAYDHSRPLIIDPLVISVSRTLGAASDGSLPVCTLTPSPASIFAGDSSSLTANCYPGASDHTWSGGGVTIGAPVTCTTLGASGSCLASTVTVTVSPTLTTTYTVTPSNGAGTGTAISATVSVTLPPVPTCSLTASPASIIDGSSSILTANCNPAATSYVWSAAACASSSKICTVTPTATTVYSVKGINAGGTGTAIGTTVTVSPPPGPACALTASPASIFVGNSSVLTANCFPAPTSYLWSSAACAVSSPTCTVKPPLTTSYTVTGINANGNGNLASATVSVSAMPKPSCTLSASPTSIVSGSASTLTASCSPTADSYVWSSTACSPTAATCTVKPSATTAYTVAGTNIGGTGPAASATVTVTAPPSPPTCTLSASPSTISAGGFSTLAASCSPLATSYAWSANTGFSSTVAGGTVAPAVTTDFSVTGSNAGGSGNTAVASVNVIQPVTSTYLLTVGKSGNGSVTSNFPGIDCGNSCAAYYEAGTSVALTATAAPGNYFVGWSGACNGPGACSVTMDAAKSVAAGFRPKPFAFTTNFSSNGITSTLRTGITFNGPDLGKQGSVFITGWVPFGSLTALGVSSADVSLIVTRTQDDPNSVDAASLRISQGTLAETDASSFVLVQLTSSGWQAVVNGQLVPYTSGVLGDALAAQTILNNADTSKLAGAQLCLGYGTSSTEMVASGRMLPVASIGEPTTSGSCNVAANPPPSPHTGLFWNADESGWGMSITQQASMIFAAWYVYDAIGRPTWYVMPSCPMSGNACTSDIYGVVGGVPLGVPWNGAGKIVTKAGSGTLTYADNDNATFNFTLNGVVATKKITRQMFATGSSAPLFDYSALWWNADESGWGVALSQQYGMIFAAIYTYDASGNAIWYVASSCPVVGSGCTGALYQVTGGSAPTVAWRPNKVVTPVGTATFSFTDGSIGTMTTTINGVSSTKAITRQSF
jgi:hypothetical protein